MIAKFNSILIINKWVLDSPVIKKMSLTNKRPLLFKKSITSLEQL